MNDASAGAPGAAFASGTVPVESDALRTGTLVPGCVSTALPNRCGAVSGSVYGAVTSTAACTTLSIAYAFARATSSAASIAAIAA